MEIQNLKELKVSALKELLKKHSLPIYGKKVELISRLQKGIESLANVFSKKTAEDEDDDNEETSTSKAGTIDKQISGDESDDWSENERLILDVDDDDANDVDDDDASAGGSEEKIKKKRNKFNYKQTHSFDTYDDAKKYLEQLAEDYFRNKNEGWVFRRKRVTKKEGYKEWYSCIFSEKCPVQLYCQYFPLKDGATICTKYINIIIYASFFIPLI